jgi:hypothetical protein
LCSCSSLRTSRSLYSSISLCSSRPN